MSGLRLLRADGCAPLPGMIGEHPLMREAYRRARRFAATELPVMLVGETGTGKELVARAIHDLSPRSAGPFVAVNAAALPDSLFESEVFGHEAGAFSDARTAKPGLLEIAERGSFFCDELAALPRASQAKLLRAVEEGLIWRVGAVRPRTAAPRWITAWRATPGLAAEHEGVRDDLWHRLAGGLITLPPLRARRSDIPALVACFMREPPRPDGGCPLGIEPTALELLLDHDWPGNVRELRMTVHRAVALCAAPVLDGEAVREALYASGAGLGSASPRSPAALRRLLQEHGGDTAAAARAAGIGRSTLYLWLKQAGLRPRPADDSNGSWNPIGIRLESGTDSPTDQQG